MRSKFSRIAFVAGISLALAFTFSCSGGDDDVGNNSGGGNNKCNDIANCKKKANW